MENLAGRESPHATGVCRRELDAAGVLEVPVAHGIEVFSGAGGALGHFRFRRAWYYWCVSGLAPLEMAAEMYAAPVGRADVRVAGNCTRPAPDEYAVWLAPDGRAVLDHRQRAECAAYAGRPARETCLVEICRDILDRHHFAADPSLFPGARGYVADYHIDSAAGLRLFADAARRHGLDGAEVPAAHARVAVYEAAEARRRARPVAAPV